MQFAIRTAQGTYEQSYVVPHSTATPLQDVAGCLGPLTELARHCQAVLSPRLKQACHVTAFLSAVSPPPCTSVCVVSPPRIMS